MRELRIAAGSVSRETEQRLQAYLNLLAVWNQKINLVGGNEHDGGRIEPRHLIDSLQLAPFVGMSTRAVDLGSGAGFPGLVLSLVTNVHFDLIEADKRKAAFLREASRLTGAPTTVHACRVEECPCGPAPLITARAVAPLPKLLNLAEPYMQQDTLCIFPKGKHVDEEINAAQAFWRMRIMRHRSVCDTTGVILCLSEVERV